MAGNKSQQNGSDPVMPIAIVGLAGRYPGDAANPEKLWKMITEARSAMTEVPADRFNIDAFYHPHNERSGAINVRGGHYMDHVAIDAFDAPFFSITPNEAKAMDPQQRMALECTFEALENAGVKMEDITGSETSCYVGSFSKDYSEMMAADQEDLPLYYGVGTGTAILSNRISWFFDLKGPSISIDTACSSALVALHLGCQSLRTGESTMSIVGGVNFMLVPGVMTAMTALHFLSPDSKCHSFDEEANGYARGEGASFVVLKPLDQAIRDHDVIRGVIRNTAVNQDGNTPGITVPSASSQEKMIRKCYGDAGLDFSGTQYVEAHGTGTQAGDPQEASALAATFGKSRTSGDPCLIGSIKTNIGHLEGASGLAQVTKAIFALEKGVIPPNLWYNKPNARIPMDDWNLKVVDQLTPWPTAGPRRISINSFGYGGTNAHCIIDDAFHFLEQRNLIANHNTAGLTRMSRAGSEDSAIGGTVIDEKDVAAFTADDWQDWLHHRSSKKPTSNMKLLVWSSNEQSGVERTSQLYREYLTQKIEEEGEFQTPELFEKFARTLASRRSLHPWRSYAVAASTKEAHEALESPVRGKRSKKALKIGFIFTGQGAQWFAMGRELLAYKTFAQSLEDADTHLTNMGTPWSLLEELLKTEGASRINLPEFSQPICTALQVALVDLLAEWGIEPSAVAGHSSGEIGAAYAKGAISREAAWEISYHRGRLAAALPELAPRLKGAMLATGLGAEAIQPYLERLTAGVVQIACKNSPTSTTISGDADAIAELEEILKGESHFARRLVVNTAYHSKHMLAISDAYLKVIQRLKPNRKGKKTVQMFSSVTGEIIEAKDLTPEYWVQNMVNPVDFIGAVQKLVRYSPSSRRATKPFVDLFLELGPHAALKGPLKDILKAEGAKAAELAYGAVVERGRDARESALNVAGLMFQQGHAVNIAAINEDSHVLGKDGHLVDIPPFAWNRKNTYWAESQISRNYRFREHPRTDLIGATIPEMHTMEPLYRNVMKTTEIPWVECHQVQGTILYPAAGMLVMAIEACNQSADKSHGEIEGFEIQDVIIGKAIVIQPGDEGTETMVSLRPWRTASRDLESFWNEFRIFSRKDREWELNCSGLVRPRYVTAHNELFHDEQEATKKQYLERFRRIEEGCHKQLEAENHYNNLAMIGLGFAGPFKSICSVKKGDFKSRCDISIPDTKSMMPEQYEFPHVIHPSTLDCVIQVGLAGATQAEKDLMVPLIPTFVGKLFVSNQIAREPGQILHGVAAIENEGFDDAQGSFIVFDEGFNKPVVTLENVKSTALRHGELGLAQAANMRKLASYLSWEEDIKKLSPFELVNLCTAATEELEAVSKSTVADLEHAAFIYMKRVLAEISSQEVKKFEPHFQKFYQLMRNTFHQVIDGSIPHQARGTNWLSCGSTVEEELLERVAKTTADGAAMCRHGEHLPAIMRGEERAIEVLMQDDLLNNFYQYGQGNAQVYAQLARYVDLLGHKKPDLKILEIGAGTGGATLPVLRALGGRNGSSPRLSEYTFTDISSGFFEKAHAKFKPWLPFMKFSKLDISQDPASQGFKAGDYDLIIAANVLHATPSMDVTLSNVHKLLKPDGKLVMSEITNPLLRIHMIVGSFDGWWAGEGDGREWGPTMTEETWDKVLRRNAFTGLDLRLRDLNDEEDHFYTLLVSSASQPKPDELPSELVLVRPNTDFQAPTSPFWQELEKRLSTHEVNVRVVTVEDTDNLDIGKQPFVFALDCEEGHELLTEIDEETWDRLKSLILGAPYSVFLTRGATINSEAPSTNLIAGLARCIRAENPGVSFTTLDLDPARPKDCPTNVDLSLKIIASAATSIDSSRPDWEFAIRDDRLLVPRILLEDGVNELLSSLLVDPKPEPAPLSQPDRPLQLRIGAPGRLDTLHFVDDNSYEEALEETQVEIKVKAVGLNFKDIMISMGQIQEHDLGLDCSGVVSRVGAAVTNVKEGDRVLTWGPGTFRNYFRTPSAMAFKIPDTLDYSSAAALPLAYSTAYYAVYEAARLKKGETVLIHGGAGAVGQAAINLANHIGAKVFATVSTKEKKKVLVEKLGVPAEHIFNSRDNSFVEGIMRMTNKKGVDVVLNSLAGEPLLKSWNCIAWFGRFIEMGQKDIENNTRLDMAPFIRNVSFTSINLTGVLKYDLPKCSEVLSNVVDLLAQGIAKPILPTTSMPFSQIEEGFRMMQLGKHVGKIVFEATDDDTVSARPPAVKPAQFAADATYLLAGGMGGIGRSVARWMVKHGARNFVFLSRSGGSKPEAQATLSALEGDGAKATAYACDISEEDNLKVILEKIKAECPPIKGLIQCAMVLNDAIYQNMTHDQYMRSTRPKVQGSWNLHNHLPEDMDFFVMLSSSAGIAGSRGQGNYAAGNTFEDALANYRQAKGLPASSIDLGMILDVGYVAETTNQDVADNTKKWSFAGIREDELHMIMQCAITATSIRGQIVPSQLITGLGTGGMAKLAGYEIPWWFNDAKFAHIKNVDTSKVQTESEGDNDEINDLLAAAGSLDAAAEVVAIALVRKLSKSLMVELEDIDTTKPVSRHGVDSLLAVEVRAWLFTDLQADISVFQLLSNVPITELARDIAAKSKLVPASAKTDA